MSAPRRAATTLAVLAAVATLGACGGSDTTDEPAAPAPAGTATTATTSTAPAGPEATAYGEDVAEARRSLADFATTLQALQTPQDLAGREDELERQLDAFDRTIGGLDGYALEDAALRDQRAELVRTGPPVSDVLRRFLAAAGEEDIAAVQGLVPEVQRALTEFQAAAGGSAP